MRRSIGLSQEHPNNTPRVVVLVIIIVALYFLSLYFYPRAPRTLPPEETLEKRTFILKDLFSYENRGADIWNLTKEDFTIGLFKNNSWQTVYLVNHSLPVRSFEIDEDGNYVAVLNPTGKQVFPETVLSYSVEYVIVTKPRSLPDIDEESSLSLSDIPEGMREEFSEAEGPWQVDNPEIVDLAHRITGNETKVLPIVKRFIEWIGGNIRYGNRDGPRYPNETLKEGSGDCDDQANLLITFCRVYGIPAHLQIGCIYISSKVNETSHYWGDHFTIRSSRVGWHGWAMVYVPPWGWLPVDLTYAQGISEDPLNAIENSAVTLQETVQYMNVTETDYIASSISLRRLLQKHGFYIYEYEEMREESTTTIAMDGQESSEVFVVNPVVSGVSKIMAKTYKWKGHSVSPQE